MTTSGGDIRLQLYRSTEHDCSYLDEQSAGTLFLDPAQPLDPTLYGLLIDHGFRRSGSMVYRPDCPLCSACQSIRVPVARFEPRRSQRRIWQRLQPVTRVREKPCEFDEKHYLLFRDYLRARHAEGEMNNTSEQGYMDFIGSDWSDTRLLEFRLDGQLLAIAVTDFLPQGMSAVYTFFDPSKAKLAPGVFAILWQIEACRERDGQWLYLGYWIEQCRKMAYKSQYRPCERFVADHWEPLG